MEVPVFSMMKRLEVLHLCPPLRGGITSKAKKPSSTIAKVVMKPTRNDKFESAVCKFDLDAPGDIEAHQKTKVHRILQEFLRRGSNAGGWKWTWLFRKLVQKIAVLRKKYHETRGMDFVTIYTFSSIPTQNLLITCGPGWCIITSSSLCCWVPCHDFHTIPYLQQQGFGCNAPITPGHSNGDRSW